MGGGQGDRVRDGEVQEVGGVSGDRPREVHPEEERSEEEEDHQQTPGDAPDRRVSNLDILYGDRLKDGSWLGEVCSCSCLPVLPGPLPGSGLPRFAYFLADLCK